MPFVIPKGFGGSGGPLKALAKANLPSDESLERARRDKVPTPPGFGATKWLYETLAGFVEPTAEDQLFSLAGPLAPMPAAALRRLVGGKTLYHGTSKEGFDLLKPNRGAAFTTPDRSLAADFAGSGRYNPPRILPFKGRPEANLFDFRDPKEVDKVVGLIKENDLALAGIRKGDPRAEWAAERIERIREDLKDGLWTTMEKYQKEIKAAGFDGYLEKEFKMAKGPTSYAFFDPDKDLMPDFVGPPRDVDNPIFPHGREDWSGTPTGVSKGGTGTGATVGPPVPAGKLHLPPNPQKKANAAYLKTAMKDATTGGDHDLKVLLTQANIAYLTDPQKAYAVAVYKKNKAKGLYPNPITDVETTQIFADVKDEVNELVSMADLDHNKLW